MGRPIAFRFSEKKATEAAAFVLKLHGRPLGRLHLIKVLYLADRESLRQYGRPITRDRYVSMDNGPVLSAVLDLINATPDTLSPVARTWARHIERVGDRDVTLVKDADFGLLSQAEMDLLKAAYAKYGRMGVGELIKLTHRLPEWKDPEGSALPIRVEDLLGHLGKSREDVDQIAKEAEEQAHFDNLLAE